MKIAEDYLVPSAMVEVRWSGGRSCLFRMLSKSVVGWLETEGREDGEDNRGEETWFGFWKEK